MPTQRGNIMTKTESMKTFEAYARAYEACKEALFNNKGDLNALAAEFVTLGDKLNELTDDGWTVHEDFRHYVLA